MIFLYGIRILLSIMAVLFIYGVGIVVGSEFLEGKYISSITNLFLIPLGFYVLQISSQGKILINIIEMWSVIFKHSLIVICVVFISATGMVLVTFLIPYATEYFPQFIIPFNILFFIFSCSFSGGDSMLDIHPNKN